MCHIQALGRAAKRDNVQGRTGEESTDRDGFPIIWCVLQGRSGPIGLTLRGLIMAGHAIDPKKPKMLLSSIPWIVRESIKIGQTLLFR